ncbi:hypothetical protein ACFYPH_12765 [Micromonospora sp. NPDC005252]|uniref:hypothetical protein n=1 Tax=Micromonospora sp. NPDC005252 TaxID=3364228 RepID=UPI003693939C
MTVPDNNGIAGLLRDRGSFESKPFAKRLDEASEVWVFAPSAVNILAQDHCEALRSKILSRSNGIVRVVVLDPAREDSLRLAVRQLDESVEYPSQTLTRALGETLGRLALMASWEVPGGFAYRLLDYNPGFSIVAIDPGRRHGVVIVEFHGFHNTSTTSRMHIELAKADSDRWHEYWLEQFDRIWRDAKEPASNGSPSSSDRARGRLNAATEAAG